MSLAGSLQSYIYGQANQQLAGYGLGVSKMGLPVSISGSASSSASSGPSKSGDISGGTAFNIGGINLGTQYPTAATAGGGTPATQSLVGGLFGSYTVPLALAGVAVLLILVLRK